MHSCQSCRSQLSPTCVPDIEGCPARLMLGHEAFLSVLRHMYLTVAPAARVRALRVRRHDLARDRNALVRCTTDTAPCRWHWSRVCPPRACVCVFYDLRGGASVFLFLPIDEPFACKWGACFETMRGCVHFFLAVICSFFWVGPSVLGHWAQTLSFSPSAGPGQFRRACISCATHAWP